MGDLPLFPACSSTGDTGNKYQFIVSKPVCLCVYGFDWQQISVYCDSACVSVYMDLTGNKYQFIVSQPVCLCIYGFDWQQISVNC